MIKRYITEFMGYHYDVFEYVTKACISTMLESILCTFSIRSSRPIYYAKSIRKVENYGRIYIDEISSP